MTPGRKTTLWRTLAALAVFACVVLLYLELQTETAEEPRLDPGLAQAEATDRTAPSQSQAIASPAGRTPEATTNPSEDGTLRVLVVDTEGDSVAAARVAVWPTELWPRSITTVRTNDAGETTLELAAGKYEVSVNDDSKQTATLLPGELQELVFRVRASGLAVRIIDDTDRQVEGAWTKSSSGSLHLEHFHCCSDRLGNLAVGPMAPGARIRAFHPDYWPSERKLLSEVDDESGQLVLRLQTGTPGKVCFEVSAGGVAVEDFTLSLKWARAQGEVLVWSSGDLTDGCVTGLRPGAYEAAVHAPSHGVWSGSLDVRAGETENVAVDFRPGSNLQVLVTDAAGVPAARAHVVVVLGFGVGAGRILLWTDSSGACALSSLAPGNVKIHVEHPELGVAQSDVTLEPGGNHHAHLLLSLDGMVRGRVTDSSGSGLPEWLVGRPSADQPSLWADMTHTDEEGAFTLQTAWGDSARILEVRPGGLKWGAVVHRELLGEDQDYVDIRIPDDKIPSASVEFLPVDRAGLSVETGKMDLQYIGAAGQRLGYSWENGSGTLGPLLPGDYRLHLLADGFVPKEVDFQLSHRESLSLREVTLDRAGTLHVRIDGLAEDDKSSLQCLLTDVDLPEKRLRKPIEGRSLSFESLRESEYEVSLWQDGHIVDTKTVSVVSGQAARVYLTAK